MPIPNGDSYSREEFPQQQQVVFHVTMSESPTELLKDNLSKTELLE